MGSRVSDTPLNHTPPSTCFYLHPMRLPPSRGCGGWEGGCFAAVLGVSSVRSKPLDTKLLLGPSSAQAHVTKESQRHPGFPVPSSQPGLDSLRATKLGPLGMRDRA